MLFYKIKILLINLGELNKNLALLIYLQKIYENSYPYYMQCIEVYIVNILFILTIYINFSFTVDY